MPTSLVDISPHFVELEASMLARKMKGVKSTKVDIYKSPKLDEIIVDS